MRIGETNSWRETQRPAKFMFLDARIVVFAALALLHFRIWTLALLCVAAAILFVLERKKINPSSLPRIIGACLGGPGIRARSPAEERHGVDYAFEMNDPKLRGFLAKHAIQGCAVAHPTGPRDQGLRARDRDPPRILRILGRSRRNPAIHFGNRTQNPELTNAGNQRAQTLFSETRADESDPTPSRRYRSLPQRQQDLRRAYGGENTAS